MVYKRFRINLITRIIILVFSVFLLFALAEKQAYTISTFILFVIILFQVFLLVRYVEITNQKLTKFLASIKYADFSTSFSDHDLGKSFRELNHQFNQIIDQFRKYRAEKEEHANYLYTVVQHIRIGIMAFGQEGKVDMYNNAVKQLFNIHHLRNINELKIINPDLPITLLKMRAGDRQLFKIFTNDEIRQIAMSATQFRMRGEEYTLVSLQDIHAELEEKEIESWQKLIRVLTHEIMNSMTPITSLITTAQDIIFTDNEKSLAVNPLDEEDIESLDTALRTIKNRSQGLLNFVEIYRNLTRIPKPNFRYFEVNDLFDRASELLKPKLEKYGIHCVVKVSPKDLKVTADPDLMDQVIINLLLNAIDAVKDVEKPAINVFAALNSHGRVSIDLKDNGHGIKPDILDKIFMPFFTSKKEGSGIGLSLSRQIMHLHKGTISVRSAPGEGATFTLTF